MKYFLSVLVWGAVGWTEVQADSTYINEVCQRGQHDLVQLEQRCSDYLSQKVRLAQQDLARLQQYGLPPGRAEASTTLLGESWRQVEAFTQTAWPEGPLEQLKQYQQMYVEIDRYCRSVLAQDQNKDDGLTKMCLSRHVFFEQILPAVAGGANTPGWELTGCRSESLSEVKVFYEACNPRAMQMVREAETIRSTGGSLEKALSETCTQADQAKSEIELSTYDSEDMRRVTALPAYITDGYRPEQKADNEAEYQAFGRFIKALQSETLSPLAPEPGSDCASSTRSGENNALNASVLQNRFQVFNTNYLSAQVHKVFSEVRSQYQMMLQAFKAESAQQDTQMGDYKVLVHLRHEGLCAQCEELQNWSTACEMYSIDVPMTEQYGCAVPSDYCRETCDF